MDMYSKVGLQMRKNYSVNVAVSITSNLTLYAKWELADYTVTFETNGEQRLILEKLNMEANYHKL